MTDYNGKVVVITGAANGIGKELAYQYAAKGAKLALTDIDANNLAIIQKDLSDKGTEVLIDAFDISSWEKVEQFAGKIFAQFGTVDYLFNNAGVLIVGTIWEEPLADWEWLWKINVMGVVNGIKAFVPTMIKQDKECHVVNTASMAGIATIENSPAYVASKFAAVALTEVMDLQLQQANTQIKGHVIIPAMVATDLNNCTIHRVQEGFDPNDPAYQSEDFKTRKTIAESAMDVAIPVKDAVEIIINEIEQDVFYIFTHPVYKPAAMLRGQQIASGKRPMVPERKG